MNGKYVTPCGEMYQIQRPRGRAAYSMNQAELSYRAHLYQSVRSNLKVFTGWTFWCQAHEIEN